MPYFVKMKREPEGNDRGDTAACTHRPSCYVIETERERENKCKADRVRYGKNEREVHLIIKPSISFLCRTPHFKGQSVKSYCYAQMLTITWEKSLKTERCCFIASVAAHLWWLYWVCLNRDMWLAGRFIGGKAATCAVLTPVLIRLRNRGKAFSLGFT